MEQMNQNQIEAMHLKQMDDQVQIMASSSETAISSFQVANQSKTQDTCYCRICLNECPNLPFCECKGSMMFHISCLFQCILKISENSKLRMNCQICSHPFAIILGPQTKLSWPNIVSQLKSNIFSILINLLYHIIFSILWLFVVIKVRQRQTGIFWLDMMVTFMYDFKAIQFLDEMKDYVQYLVRIKFSNEFIRCKGIRIDLMQKRLLSKQTKSRKDKMNQLKKQIKEIR